MHHSIGSVACVNTRDINWCCTVLFLANSDQFFGAQYCTLQRIDFDDDVGDVCQNLLLIHQTFTEFGLGATECLDHESLSETESAALCAKYTASVLLECNIVVRGYELEQVFIAQ